MLDSLNITKNDSYAGDLSPQEAWEILLKEDNSYLVDVRTLPEWTFVGYPNLKKIGKEVIRISWRIYPTMQINNEFAYQLMAQIKDKDAKILFLCRSGGRSMDAAIAMTNMGYNYCYNIEGGFEGELDIENRRGKQSGWKAINLPWEQN